MTRVAGPSLEQLDRLGDDYAGLVAESLATVAVWAADVEDLVVIRSHWAITTDALLLPALGVAFEVGAAQIRVGLREAAGLTAAAFADVARTSDALAEQYLAQARNRLVGVGDELWAHAREELLEGLQAGEGIPELAARVRKAAPDLTEPRAAVIARTEIAAAATAGAYEQVIATGATGTKEWVATDDQRTRHSHDLADHAVVPLTENFHVGGFPMSGPHDWRGPAHETINCRCALAFDLDLPDLEPVTVGEVVESEPEESDRTTSQQRDRSFLARVFADGLAALVGWFKARTAAAMIPEQTFEQGADMTVPTAEVPQPPPEHWHAVMATEGVSTGLRMFSDNAITWRNPPFALMWQKMTPESGGHALAVQVGLVSRVERHGAEIHGWGPLDLGSEDGREYARQLVEGFARWGSVGPDEEKIDVEVVMPADAPTEGLEALVAEPEQFIFHSFNIAEFTAVSIPALADATIEPTPTLLEAVGAETAQAITAAAHTITIQDVPPASWFEEPTAEELAGGIGAITVTDEGRLFGLLGPARVGHRGWLRAGRTVYIPQGNVDYSKFMNKPALAERDGRIERIAAGNVTADCNHGPLHSAAVAREHYENSCSVMARIRVGENDQGVWVAGALLPDITPGQVARMFACALSGHWDSHETMSGWQELTAALLVPAEGFPKAHKATVRVRDGQLVASAVPIRHETCACSLAASAAPEPDLSKVKLRIARPILKSRKAAAAARVGKGG